MEPSFVLVLLLAGFAGLIVLLVVAGATGRRNEQRRLAGIAAWAAAHGWQYVPAPGVDWHQRLPGRNKRGIAWTVLGVAGGRRVSVGEYTWTEASLSTDGQGNSTTSSTTYRHVVAVVHLDRPLGRLMVQPRGALSRLGRAVLGAEPVTGDAGFDKRFRVVGAVPVPLPPRLLAAHLAGAVPPWSVHDADLMIHVPGRIDDPAAIPGYAGPALHVADLLALRA